MEYAIEVEDLWWRYEYAKDWVLKGINLKIKPGEFVVITGPNDSGKSTLVMTFNGLIPHSQRGHMKGIVKVLGQNTIETTIPALCAYVGMTFQDPETQFLLSRVEDEVAFGPQNYRLPLQEHMDPALEAAGLVHLRGRRTLGLSGGEQQRTALAALLALQPRLLILDEPTMGQDWGHMSAFMGYVRALSRQGVGVLLITHDYKLVHHYADRVLLLQRGRIVADGRPQGPPPRPPQNPEGSGK